MAMKSKYTNIDLSKYDKGYQKSNDVKLAEQKKLSAENALKNYGEFSYKNQSAYDATLNAINNRGKFQYSNSDAYGQALNALLNRDKFSYDLNGDALYQQYKDNYMTQGKLAMMDTMGQAAAMTGGYGNSYAATVGNQAYQGYLQGLNDMVPQLYQMALDQYNSESDRLAQNFSVLSADRDTERGEFNDETARLQGKMDVLSADRNAEYGLWSDKRNQLEADRGYYSDAYNNAYNQDYTAWNDNRTYDTTQYWNEHNAGYQAAQDAIANQLARDQLNETIRANKASEAAAWAKVNKEDEEEGGNTAGVPDDIDSKAASFENNDALEYYLTSLEGSGKITHEQALVLLARHSDYNEIRKDENGETRKATIAEMVDRTSGWSVVNNGGANLFGMDRNAIVKAPNGMQYRLSNLFEALKAEGKSSSEARKQIVKLQKNLGI